MKSLRELGGPTPWEHIGLNRSEYMARAPWRALGMPRAVFEARILARPADDFVELRRSADAQALVNELFGG